MNTYSDEILNYTIDLIIKKYDLSNDSAKKYAKQLLEQIYNHGGNTNDKNEILSVVDIVLKSWINNE